MQKEDPLDNPVWHALGGPLARFVSPDSPSFLRQFDAEVSVFSGVDLIDSSTWSRVSAHVGSGGFCALFRDQIDPAPGGWEEHFRGSCWQMVADQVPGPSSRDLVELGAADREEMLALAQLTEPGPFFLRTHELGRYLGIRREGKLVAMAGERFRVPGFVEVSAVCTHPDARGEGLGTQLTLSVVQGIRAGGNEAFLHVLNTNEDAYRLYQALGFRVRRSVEVVFAEWHGEGWVPASTVAEP